MHFYLVMLYTIVDVRPTARTRRGKIDGYKLDIFDSVICRFYLIFRRFQISIRTHEIFYVFKFIG
jgi:hypothetical protein